MVCDNNNKNTNLKLPSARHIAPTFHDFKDLIIPMWGRRRFVCMEMKTENKELCSFRWKYLQSLRAFQLHGDKYNSSQSSTEVQGAKQTLGMCTKIMNIYACCLNYRSAND